MRYRLGRRRAPTRVTRRTATLISTCCYQALRRRVRVGVASPRLRNERVTSSEFRSAVFVQVLLGLSRRRPGPDTRRHRGSAPAGGLSLSVARPANSVRLASGSLGTAPAQHLARPGPDSEGATGSGPGTRAVASCMTAGAALSTLPGSPRRSATWRGSASTPARGPACRPAASAATTGDEGPGAVTRLKETSERLS